MLTLALALRPAGLRLYQLEFCEFQGLGHLAIVLYHFFALLLEPGNLFLQFLDGARVLADVMLQFKLYLLILQVVVIERLDLPLQLLF